ncbi:MAG: endopeptidase La [Oscillospiraceae bacterium]|nr:endopeptidase La [Oscillospiraceae bacterium]
MPDKKELEVLTMPMIAMRGIVLFPSMILHFDVGRKKSIAALEEAMKGNRTIFLAAQKNVEEDEITVGNINKIGVVAEVRQVIKNNGGTTRILVEGKYRAKLVDVIEEEPFLVANIQEFPLKKLRPERSILCDALIRTVKDLFNEYTFLVPKMPKELIVKAFGMDDPVQLGEFLAGNLNIDIEDKQSILEESNYVKRLEMLAGVLENENNILGVEKDIYEKVKEQIDQNQREYYLREQLKAITEELGEGENVQDEADAYKKKIEALGVEGEVKDKLLEEVARLFKMPFNSQEASVIRGYLDTCIALPWNVKTEEKIDIVKAKKQLDKNHYGLEKVKERILELLAVRKLQPDIKGQIICLVGPPGVGKTSIAKDIAAAMGRKYTRISLGGMKDESDIRGHRKTYIGAMPGRIMNAVKLAGSKNALILLDEIDKMGSDFRGDPASAMLEVLDPEQNSSFRDHYIEVPFDLSDVLFITTANDPSTIPGPLYDRMEIIELSSYTREEKFQIGKKHLLKKEMKRHGMDSKMLKITDDAIYSILDFYTREAGVRNLERIIGSLCRKAAKKIVGGEAEKVVINGDNITEFLGVKKFRPETIEENDSIGLVNGLAWTSVGGDMLQVEVAILDGNGKIELTGNLGDVMKESAKAAISYVRSCTEKYGIEHDFYKTKDIHIHVPEGAVPKDGPSAGVTLTTAIVSALSGIPVRRDVAMTGEITLRGRVLAIGGLREKTMAAYRAGVKTVLIPKDNIPDLEEVDPVVKKAITFVPASEVETVLETALLKPVEANKKDDRFIKEISMLEIEQEPNTINIQ